MIQCPKCGEENQIGAIFCRGCGERLDLDDLRPESFLSKDGERTKAQTIAHVIKNLLILLVIFGVIGTVVMAFLQPIFTMPNTLNEEETKNAMLKFKKLVKGGAGSQHEFSNAEINMLSELVLELDEENKMKAREKLIQEGESTFILPDKLFVELLPPANIKVVLKSIVYDKLNLYTTLVGTVTASANGLSFAPAEVMVGRLPVPIPKAQEPIIELYLKLIRNNEKFKQEIQTKVREIKLEVDKAILKK